MLIYCSKITMNKGALIYNSDPQLIRTICYSVETWSL